MSSSDLAGTRSRLAAISSPLEPEVGRRPAVEAIRAPPHGVVASGCDRRDDLLDDAPDGTVEIRALVRCTACFSVCKWSLSWFDYVCIDPLSLACQIGTGRRGDRARGRRLPCSGRGRDEQRHRPPAPDQPVDGVPGAPRRPARRPRDEGPRARGGARDELHAEPGGTDPDHPEDGHGRGRRQRHHEPVLPRAPRDPPQRVRAGGLSHGPVQRADGRERRAAPRRPRQRSAADGIVYVSATLGSPLPGRPAASRWCS